MSTFNFSPALLTMVKRIVFPFNTLTERDITLKDYFKEIYTEPTLMLVAPNATHRDIATSVPELIGQKLVLTGAMGAGKSTYLLWLYQTYQSSFEAGKQKSRPFIFSLPQYFSDDNIRKAIIEKKDEMIILVDSLDETVSSIDRSKLYEAIELFLDCPSVIIACRSPFFYDLFTDSRRARLDRIIEMEPLNEEKQKTVITKFLQSSYLTKLASITNAQNTAFDIVAKCRKKNVAETTIIATPLFSALTAIVAVKQAAAATNSQGVIDVYNEFVKDIVTRKFESQEDINRLSEVAYKLNTAHLQGDVFTIDDISADYGENFISAFKDMVQIKESTLGTGQIIIDFRHRSVGEFLLARYISCKLSDASFIKDQIPKLFDRLLNYEVSFFIRSLFDQIPNKKKTAINELFHSFVAENLTTQQDDQILSVHNCLYFSRFLTNDWKPYALEMGDKFFSKKDDISPLILGTYLSGVISCEAVSVQVQFLKATTSSESTRLVNRNLNYYLFYYGDSEYQETDDFNREITEATSWDNTRSVLLNRLKDEKIKKRFFRCHDLVILRQFLERTKRITPPKDIDAIRKIVSDPKKLLIDVANLDIIETIRAEIKNIRALTEPVKSAMAEKTDESYKSDNHIYIISIAPNWGYEEGGINGFNFDFNLSLAKHINRDLYKVICIAHVDPSHKYVKEFEKLGGEIMSLEKKNSDPEVFKDIDLIKQKINKLPKDSHIVLVGHDVFTGELAIHFAQEFHQRSTSVIFHHMDYQSYSGIKGYTSPEDLDKKIEKQELVFGKAEIAIGVGPKLYDSVLRKTNANLTKCYQLLPGLQSIEARDDNNDKIVAVAFGRYDKRTDNLKQMRLATNSFAQYVSNNRTEAKNDATLQVIGVSKGEEADLLKSEYMKDADGYINVVFLPYNTDKSKLFKKLAASNIGMMLSTHEGFGLVGLEIIGAGVPLILSENTGLFEFLLNHITRENFINYGIFTVKVLGSNDGDINPKDQKRVVEAIGDIWKNLKTYKTGIMNLRSLLAKEIPWEKTCSQFINIIEENIHEK